MADDPDCLSMCQMVDGYCLGCGRSEAQIAQARGEPPAPPSVQAHAGTDLQTSAGTGGMNNTTGGKF